MILNKLLILVLSVESFAYNSQYSFNDNNILNDSDNKLSSKFGEETPKIASGYRKDNVTDSFEGM